LLRRIRVFEPRVTVEEFPVTSREPRACKVLRLR
jgi:hypothetical protein